MDSAGNVYVADTFIRPRCGITASTSRAPGPARDHRPDFAVHAQRFALAGGSGEAAGETLDYWDGEPA